MFSVLGKVHSQSLVTSTPRLSPRLPRTEPGLCAGCLQLSEVWSSAGLYGPACLQCPLKCFAADVHDWAMQSLSKSAGERHTSAHQLLHGLRNCRGVDNGVMLKPAWIKRKHPFSCHCNYCSWLSTIRFGSLEFLQAIENTTHYPFWEAGVLPLNHSRSLEAITCNQPSRFTN